MTPPSLQRRAASVSKSSFATTSPDGSGAARPTAAKGGFRAAPSKRPRTADLGNREPEPRTLGFNGLVHGLKQFVPDRVEVDRVAKASTEGCDCRLGVVSGPVEVAIEQPLRSRSERVEERSSREGRGGHTDSRRERENARREQDKPDEQSEQE